MEELEFNNRVIHNATIEFKGKIDGYIGNKAEICNSTIIISIPTKRFLVGDSTICNSKVILKKTLVNMRWLKAKFISCSFEGHFCGNDFGNWLTDEDRNGKVKDCDFSKANLDGCRFMDVDVSTIIFPKFPNYTLLNPLQNINSLVDLHPYFQHLQKMYDGWLPEFTSAISYNAETEKQYIGDLISFHNLIKNIDIIVC